MHASEVQIGGTYQFQHMYIDSDKGVVVVVAPGPAWLNDGADETFHTSDATTGDPGLVYASELSEVGA